MTRIGFLYTRLRAEEKYLLEELEKRDDLEVVRINDGDQFFDIHQPPAEIDVLFERSISYSRGPKQEADELISIFVSLLK